MKELSQNATNEPFHRIQRVDKVHSHAIAHSLHMNISNRTNSRIGKSHRDSSVGKTNDICGLRTILSKEKGTMEWETGFVRYI